MGRRMPRLGPVVLLSSVGILTGLAGCGSDSSQVSDGGVKVITGSASSQSDALKKFKIGPVNDRGCVTAEYESPTVNSEGILVLPDKARVNGGPDDFSIDLGDGTVVTRGDTLEGGGTYLDRKFLSKMDDANVELLERATGDCGGDVAVVIRSWL